MRDVSQLRLEIVRRIVSAGDVGAAFEAYSMARGAIADFRFVFASASGSAMGHAVNRSFAGGVAARTLFGSNHVLVLDPQTFEEMKHGRSTFPIDYSISLDTMMASYLAPLARGEGARLPSGFREVLQFMARAEVRVDPMPYLLENQGREQLTSKDHERIFDTLTGYEILRSVDQDWLRSTGDVRSTLSRAELMTRAQNAMAGMLMDIENPGFARGLKFKHDYLYLNLLQIALIHLKHQTWPPLRRLRAYLDFCHIELATINVREGLLARQFFEQGQRFSFFRRVQRGCPDVIAELKNMAWDLFHVRYLESTMGQAQSSKSRYFFPALLTRDQGLIEVLDIGALRAIAFNGNSRETVPIYERDIVDIAAAESDLSHIFSPIAADERDARRDAARQAIPSIIADLEGRVRAVVTQT
jgi:hypothetical protein